VSQEAPKQGIIFVLSAPSGAGKSSIARAVLARTSGLRFSVSHTTRPRREGESDGREYHFTEESTFREMAAHGEFLEWAEVHDRLYGTASGPVMKLVASGQDVLLEIDVQGAGQVRESCRGSVSIFIVPPDYATLERRLSGRGSDSPVQIARRLAAAREEMAHESDYDYLVINRDLEEAAEDVRSIVLAERRRNARMRPEVERVMKSFPEAERA
jgi:guanylate kinase